MLLASGRHGLVESVRAPVEIAGETLHRVEIAQDGVVCVVAKSKFG
jgi:hypothetical protein